MSDTDMVVVDVWITLEEAQKGVLNVKDGDVKISLESGEVITCDQSNVSYSVVDDSRGFQRILLNPILVTNLSYAPDIGQTTEDIFPPSSGGYYGRIRAGKELAVFIIQKIVHDTRLWLIIGDPQTGRVFETQIIQPYEAETLGLVDDQELQGFWEKEVWSDKEKQLTREIRSILDEPSPTWEMISKLIEGVSISNLVRGETFRETLTQLVPNSFPDQIREQLMAFLAHVMVDRIQMEDLIDYSSSIHSAPLFSTLIRGHLSCKIDNVKWPPYLNLILQASEGQLEQPKRTLSDLTDDSWRVALLWQKMLELFPNWFGNAMKSAQELNEDKKLRLRLPVTKAQSMRSKRLMKKRLAAMTYGLRIRGYVNPHTIGLTELVYIGVAYRWPHRHMKYITRLGIVSENPPHLQVMTAPPSAVERIVRTLPKCIKISWSKRVVNLGLYDERSDNWQIPIDNILASVNERSSMRRISRRFGSDVSAKVHQLTPNEAQVLGLVSNKIDLENFELPGYFRYWNLSRKDVSSIIKKLRKKGILQISYEVADSRLVSLALIIQGKSENVTSFVEALLTHTPTSLAMLNDKFDRGVIMSRIPMDIAYELATKLDQIGLQQDLVIRCLRPRAFRSFASTLYHRLLRQDGTWDDDVSAFLSQARSKRRELSEDNA
ncbi:MAG: hypothetical protein RTV41_08980 [Candidatus Thorarchaeota archaeon]